MIMKKFYFILAAAASVALASCTNDEIVGNSPGTEKATTDAIAFGSGLKGFTRADHVGADAASLLNNNFYVVAFKGDGSTSMSQTFDNYLVQWSANTAGTSESNTSDWEYVGKTAPAWSGITGNTQTIKYWDYSNDQYDFIAWSPGTATPVTTAPSSGKVQITKPAANSPYAPTYALTGARADLAKCYIADMVTAYKADKSPAQPKFQEEVKFSFRSLACKVRVALYETVPGYSVKNVKFYLNGSRAITAGAETFDVSLFTTGSTDADYFYTDGTYTVSFPTKGSSKLNESDYNKAHVAFAATGKGTSEGFGSLVLTGKESNEAAADVYLGRSLPQASYANPGAAGAPYYKIMLPNETGTVLQLRVDYTLLATDGSGETIDIHGARAYVPALYTTWKPNYAYTYVFKISDNTNGWTSTNTSDPAGLYPITFDAVVVDAVEHTQSTITTVASPSITTYQKGHDVTKDEYQAATGDIYVQVMKDATLANNLTTAGVSNLYSLSSGTWTEADVMDALNIQANGSSASLVKGRNGLDLADVSSTASLANNITAVPGPDGNNIEVTSGTAAKFTPAASTVYAFVYYTGTDEADTDIYSAVTFTDSDTSAPSDWTGNYWNNPDGTGSAETTYVAPASGKTKTYYRHYTNLNKVYGVKIIKVQ